MRFSLRSLFAFTALVAIITWACVYLTVRFEYQPMVYTKGQLRFSYSITMEVGE